MRPIIMLLAILAIGILLFGCIQLPGTTQPPSTPSTGGQQGTGQGAGTGTGGQTGETTGTQGAIDSTAGTGTTNQTPATQNQTTTQTGQQTPALQSQEIEYRSGAWTIHGTLYPSKSKPPTKVIMLLPSLGNARDSYPPSFIYALHENIPDAIVLAIDMRGHGESINMGTWQSFDTAAFREMKMDVISAQDYFGPNHPTVVHYYVVGSSIGSSAAMVASKQNTKIVKLAMLSPGMSYRGVDITDATEDYEGKLFLTAATGDAYSATAVSQISSLCPSIHQTVQVYGGSAHGTDLFAATETDAQPLSELLVAFFRDP